MAFLSIEQLRIGKREDVILNSGQATSFLEDANSKDKSAGQNLQEIIAASSIAGVQIAHLWIRRFKTQQDKNKGAKVAPLFLSAVNGPEFNQDQTSARIEAKGCESITATLNRVRQFQRPALGNRVARESRRSYVKPLPGLYGISRHATDWLGNSQSNIDCAIQPRCSQTRLAGIATCQRGEVLHLI
jgi:hypothetical protein